MDGAGPAEGHAPRADTAGPAADSADPVRPPRSRRQSVTGVESVSTLKSELAAVDAALQATAADHHHALTEAARLGSLVRELEAAKAAAERRLAARVAAAPPAGVDPFDALPDEVLAEVVRWLPVEVVYGVVALLSRRWHAITELPSVKRGFKSSIRWRQYAKGTRKPVVMAGHSDWVRAVAVCPTHGTIYTGSRDNTIRVWSPSGQHLRTLAGHEGAVVALTVAPDGRLFSGSWDHTIRGWCRTTGALLMTLRGHAGSVFRLIFAPSGRLLSGSEDATIRVWTVAPGEAPLRGRQLEVLKGHLRTVKDLAFAESGDLYSASWDHSIRRWHVASDGSSAHGVRGGGGAAAAERDGDDEGGAADDGAGSDDESREIDAVFTKSPVVSLVIHAAGEEIFTGSVDGAIRVWSLNLEPLRIFSPRHKGSVDALVFSLDDKLFSGCEDGSINLWARSGDLLLVLKGHTDTVVDLAVSRRTNEVISASWDTTARKW